MSSDIRQTAAALREFALGLPGTHEDFPWGERVVKVNKKVFVFLGHDENLDTQLGLSVKLPISGQDVLSLPFAEPTGYGLGKSGWVSLHFQADEIPPLAVLQRWVEESYRAIAPKRLIAEFDKSQSS